MVGVTPVAGSIWRCEDCGWRWPLADVSSQDSECDACGGEMVPETADQVRDAARAFAALDAMIRETHPRPGDTRTCPDCGRPQHYTGAELGWCHDAAVDSWECADPRGTHRQLISHLTPGCTCDHRPGDPCNANCPVHLGAGLKRA